MPVPDKHFFFLDCKTALYRGTISAACRDSPSWDDPGPVVQASGKKSKMHLKEESKRVLTTAAAPT